MYFCYSNAGRGVRGALMCGCGLISGTRLPEFCFACSSRFIVLPGYQFVFSSASAACIRSVSISALSRFETTHTSRSLANSVARFTFTLNDMPSRESSIDKIFPTNRPGGKTDE